MHLLCCVVQVDVGGSHPDLAVAALRFLPSLPPSHLGQLQAAGEQRAVRRHKDVGLVGGVEGKGRGSTGSW